MESLKTKPFRRAAWIAVGIVVLAATLAMAAFWRFWPWMPKIFFGDALIGYLYFRDGKFASTPLQALTEAITGKYRPINALVIGSLFRVFGEHLNFYLIFN